MNKGFTTYFKALCICIMALFCTLSEVKAANAFSFHPGKTEFIKIPLKQALNATSVSTNLGGVTTRIYKKYSDAIQLKVSVSPNSKPGQGNIKLVVDNQPVEVPIYVFGLGNAKLQKKTPGTAGKLQAVEVVMPKVPELTAKSPGQPHCKGASGPRSSNLVSGQFPLKYQSGAYRMWVTSTKQAMDSKCLIKLIEKSPINRQVIARDLTIEFSKS